MLRAIHEHGAAAPHVTTRSPDAHADSGSVLNSLQGTLDLEALTLSGHSWGAATVAGVPVYVVLYGCRRTASRVSHDDIQITAVTLTGPGACLIMSIVV